MKGRLLQNDLGDPYSNVAFEEAILRAGKVPTLRVWENQRCVVIGRGQLAEFETDLRYDREHMIPVIRRISAGGAVYHGPGNLNWTFFYPQEKGGFRETLDVKGVFARFAPMVVAAVRKAGARCRYVPPNTIVDDVGKISGLAAYVSKEAVLCHGTLLLHADLEEVERVTKPSSEVLKKKYPRSTYSKVSNSGADKARFIGELSSNGDGFEAGKPTGSEMKALASLVGRYRNPDWNLGDPFDLNDS